MPSPPLAITGMHRSGTSMITRGLHAAGLTLVGEGDALIDPADDNPEGFWENKQLVACNDELLEAAGGSWDNPPKLLPQAVDDPRLTHVADRATEALASLRSHGHWGFKDPRTCLTAGYWLDLEPELLFVVCVRHPLEVALSLRRRNQNSYSLGLSLWERYYRAIVDAVPADRRIITHYDTYFLDAQGEFARLCDFAGLDDVPDVPVRTDLRHHTVGVSLSAAGVSAGVIELYHQLCEDAGTPQPPESATDEGHVRRLILDGAVAERHADQRQQAIDRLEEREAEFRSQIEQLRREKAVTEGELRREKAAVEADLRAQIRRVEAELAAVLRVAPNPDDLLTAADVRAELQPLLEAMAEQRADVSRVDQAVHHTAARVEVAVAHTRPGPLKRALRKGSRLAFRGGRRYLFRPARITVERGQQAALPNAKKAARRLPPPAQTALRRGRRTVYRTRRRLAGQPATVEATAAESTAASPDTSPAPAPDQWLPAWNTLRERTIPGGAKVLVIDPDEQVGDIGNRFPRRPETGSLGAIAEVEVRRFQGYDLLAVPEGARGWLARHGKLRDHLVSRYGTEDVPGAGLIVDLGRRAAQTTASLAAEITGLTGTDSAPAVLDWTNLVIADVLAGCTVFVAPTGDTLPYFDRSVDIVVIDRSGDRREAARVAAVAVVTVDEGASGAVEVHSIEAQTEIADVVEPRLLVVAEDPNDDSVWRDRLAEAAADAGADHRFAALDAAALDAVDQYDVVAVVEAPIVPLPGSLAAAARHAAADPSTAVAGKVIGCDGTLESAGATVFFDRSVGLIANGSEDLNAPWHDYVRPVCWATGMVVAATERWRQHRPADHHTGRSFVREWCAELWAGGAQLQYQPLVTSVRVDGDGGEPPGPLHDTAWQRVLDLRPTRPAELGDGAWRYVLAHDDVEACRG